MLGKFSPLFTPPFNFPQSDLGCRADSLWALPQISSFLSFFVVFAERPDFEGGLILRRGCTVEHVVCILFAAGF